MIRSFLALASLLGWFALGAPARADDSQLSLLDRSAIRGVIEAQLAAFRADDGATAFGFASPSIQQQFGTPDNFMAMVRTGYVPVYRPREVQFGDIVEYQGQPVQLVLLVGPALAVVTAYYVMQRQPDGSWRIDGCVLGEAPEKAT